MSSADNLCKQFGLGWDPRGEWWLSGRVLDSGSRGWGLEPHLRHCLLSLSKTLYPLLSTCSTKENSSQHDWKIVHWNVKNGNKLKIRSDLYPNWHFDGIPERGFEENDFENYQMTEKHAKLPSSQSQMQQKTFFLYLWWFSEKVWFLIPYCLLASLVWILWAAKKYYCCN